MLNLSGYDGSPDIQVSESNHQVLPTGYVFHKFAFFNYEDCHVLINGSNPIYLSAGQGFSSDESDVQLKNFIIVDSDIRFNWIGSYRYASI